MKRPEASGSDRVMKDGLRQIETPCINVCVVDKHGYCSGCRRTLDEIAKWGSMSDAERQRVLSFLPGRVVGRGGAGRRGDSV